MFIRDNVSILLNKSRRGIYLTLTSSVIIYSFPAHADQISRSTDVESSTKNTQDVSDIIVTARKRDETALDVPVSLVAIGKEGLERYATRDISTIATQIPGLLITPVNIGTGGSVALRGVSSSARNPSGDQAVSFNVDGIQIGSANIVRLGMLDVAQVEVLKGPQALFFGKNSPGGIISLRTADPTSVFVAKVVGDYEINARQRSVEAVLSGPLNDVLGVRLVGYASGMDGYRRNGARAVNDPATGNPIAFAPLSLRGPIRDEQVVRGTLVFKPSSSFTLKGKFTYGSLNDMNDPSLLAERIACPYGAAQTSVAGPLAQQDDCKQDSVTILGGPDPRQQARFPQLFSFVGFESRQKLASLQADYELASYAQITSVTGYYDLHDQFGGVPVYQPAALLMSGATTKRREFSQELRLVTTNPNWPVNFTAGAFYQDAKFSIDTRALINIPFGTANLSGSSFYTQAKINGQSYSLFGQAIWTVNDKIELAGGLRWTKEDKDAGLLFTQQAAGGASSDLITQSVLLLPSNKSFNDVSPEATVTWKPTRDVTIFGAYRNGFKSGGFQTGAGLAPTPGGLNLTYLPESAEGGEIGIKARIRGGIRFNATIYRYNYTNMQLSTFDPALIRENVINAASARIQGLEIDATVRTPVDGLAMRGALNYNHARYRTFLAGCYTGQTVAEGCSISANPATGAFRQQNLAGRQLQLAPDWTGTFGFTYKRGIGDRFSLTLDSDARYSSSYWAQLEEAPLGRQGSYVTLDGSARVGGENGAWEFAVIGRNLTDVYRSNFVSQAPITGIASRTGTTQTGGLADLTGYASRGREIRFQLTFRFN